MKVIPRICLVLFIALITVSTASATPTPTLPSQGDVQTYLNSANITAPGYADKLATQIKADHPAWYFDLWKDGDAKLISIYFADSSMDGHGAIYMDDNGKDTDPSSDSHWIESYKGIAESTATNSTENNSTVNTASTPTDNDCPNCQQAQSTTSTVTVNNGSALTEEQQKQLDAFMSYFDGKEEVTIDGIREQAKKSFFGGN